MSALLILCGDVDYSLEEFDAIVTWCPSRQHTLENCGTPNHLFGDFSAEEGRGRALDAELHERINRGLLDESKITPELQLAPLAIQQIKWRLSRYLWVKECIRAMIKKFRPDRVIISTDKDDDMVRALRAIAGEYHIKTEILKGLFDGPFTKIYNCAPYGLPRALDPLWFHWLRWWCIRFLHPRVNAFLELYPNISPSYCTGTLFPFRIHRSVNFLRSLAQKLARVVHIPQSQTLVDLSPPPIDEAIAFIIHQEHWTSFSLDEQVMINTLLVRYLEIYPAYLFTRVSRFFSIIFSIMKPKRIILAVDQLDSDRLIAFVAHRGGVQVDYLPHGFVYEDYIGRRLTSPFGVDRVLAWNEASAKALRQLGWPAATIVHPVAAKIPRVMGEFPQDKQQWRVLVLVSDWEGISQERREDAALVDTIAVYQGLTRMGVPGAHIEVKFHFTPIASDLKMRYTMFERLQKSYNMEFRIVDPACKPREILSEYTLAIIGPTTGILEAVFEGVPLVFFGPGLDRLGLLQGYPIPQARTPQELIDILNGYDLDTMREVYADISRSVKAGMSIAGAVSSP